MTETPRWFLSYGFHTVDPAWRLLPEDVREGHKDELEAVLDRWSERIMVRTFSTVGIRADAELLVWRATPELELLQQMHTEMLSMELGCHLRTTHMYTATTKHSQYVEAAREAGFGRERPLTVTPVDKRYIIVYPFVKRREWYALSDEQRHVAMREHAEIGRRYPGIKINTAYSFGIDDQEFMVGFETDSVHDFLDLMMELRSTVASRYTERDVPIFTCVRMSPREALDALGGVRAAIAAPV